MDSVEFGTIAIVNTYTAVNMKAIDRTGFGSSVFICFETIFAINIKAQSLYRGHSNLSSVG